MSLVWTRSVGVTYGTSEGFPKGTRANASALEPRCLDGRDSWGPFGSKVIDRTCGSG